MEIAKGAYRRLTLYEAVSFIDRNAVNARAEKTVLHLYAIVRSERITLFILQFVATKRMGVIFWTCFPPPRHFL